MKVDGIVSLLNVVDVASSIAFYSDALGFALENKFESEGRIRWARVSCDGVALMLNEHGEERAARTARHGHRDVVLYVSVGNADELHAHLLAKGFAPGELNDEAYGLRQFQLRDPDGYEMAITSPLGGTA